MSFEKIKIIAFFAVYGWLPAIAVVQYYESKINNNLSWLFGMPFLFTWLCFFGMFIYLTLKSS